MRFVLLLLVGMFLIVAVGGGVGVAIYEANLPKVVEAVKVQHQTVRRELLVFGGPWCKPCLEMKSIVDLMRERHDVAIFHVDPQEDSGSARTAKDYGVENCPAFVVLDGIGGRVIGNFEGIMTITELDRLIETGEAPHREPTQVLDSPNRDYSEESLRRKYDAENIHARDVNPPPPAPPSRLTTDNARDRRHAERNSHASHESPAPAPKKNKPHSCPCTFGRPNPWSLR